ncbi:PH domain-containing protein [Nocardioides scoriae]|uniref:PH domain-containing protein n=1 Tax=Nocardioides scoriae TaxID=642780 RepID=A0A1H1Y248_9ACTN|nr:PH domain-containing protein [Nocardioides scoriae]SDT15544.1 PH domain-containing protein [Nocardioides scoriae]
MGRLWHWLTDPDIGDRLLKDGVDDEVIADEVTKHWVVYVVPALVGLLGLAVWVLFLFSRPDGAWFPFLAGLAVMGWGAVMAMQRNIDRFVVTSDKVFRVHGLLNRKEASMPLGRILDISVEKPLHGRVLGFGHFTFESAAQEQGLREIRFVPRIDERNLTIQRVQKKAGLRSKRLPTADR